MIVPEWPSKLASSVENDCENNNGVGPIHLLSREAQGILQS